MIYLVENIQAHYPLTRSIDYFVNVNSCFLFLNLMSRHKLLIMTPNTLSVLSHSLQVQFFMAMGLIFSCSIFSQNHDRNPKKELRKIINI